MTKKFKKHSPGKDPNDKPLGQQLNEQKEKDIQGEVPVTELTEEMYLDWEKNLIECIDNGKAAYPGKDFFVTVLSKAERLMPEVQRLYWVPRLSCPTPTYDQIVYRYHHATEELEFLWVLPDREICQAYHNDPLAVPEEERDLRQFVLDFYDGTLDKQAKILNNEKALEPRIAIRLEDIN